MTRFDGPKALSRFVKQWNGYLYGPLGLPTEGVIGDYTNVAPQESYKVISWMFKSCEEERRPSQKSDTAYEQKCRRAMIEYIRTTDPLYIEHPRKIHSDKKVLVEWEGVFEKSDGSIVFLEVKHRITFVCSCQLKEANPRIGSHCRSKG
jgi:hypothetical protein